MFDQPTYRNYWNKSSRATTATSACNSHCFGSSWCPSALLLELANLQPIFLSFKGNWGWRRSWQECFGGFDGKTSNSRVPANTTSALAADSLSRRLEQLRSCTSLWQNCAVMCVLLSADLNCGTTVCSIFSQLLIHFVWVLRLYCQKAIGKKWSPLNPACDKKNQSYPALALWLICWLLLFPDWVLPN